MKVANDLLRFSLELLALGLAGYWGWQRGDDLTRWVIMLGLPLLMATAWGVFRVPGDPKEAPVAVPGALRLGIEVIFFTIAIAALWSIAGAAWALALLLVLVGHYIVAWQRLRWLLAR